MYFTAVLLRLIMRSYINVHITASCLQEGRIVLKEMNQGFLYAPVVKVSHFLNIF